MSLLDIGFAARTGLRLSPNYAATQVVEQTAAPILWNWLVSSVERLAAGVGHQLKLHTPRGKEIDPSLTLTRALACGGLAEDFNPTFTQMGDGRIEIVDVERDVGA